MPCNSDHMNPHTIEIEMSRVACLIDELDGKPFDRNAWRGYHPTVYGKPVDKKRRDNMVAALCERLQGKDVTKQSLEMQIWWRDHQEADKARIEREKKENENFAKENKLLLKYFDQEDMCWYYGATDPRKGFHWCQDMRHTTLFNKEQVKTIRETLKDTTNPDEAGFQVWQRVE